MKKILIISGILVFVFGLGILSVLYQSNSKTTQIYSDALLDYNNKNFQNSYYLFSKVGFFADLKPYAIYRQALCAKELGDTKSEIKQYQLLFNNYPKNPLSARARYETAQTILDTNPKLAQKYFKFIIKNFPDTDLAIASEYYVGVLRLKKYKDVSKISKSDKNEIEKAFRHYLTNAPQGKHALNVVTNWLSLNTEIDKDDYLLMAKANYMYNNYENALKLLSFADPKDSWSLRVKTLYMQKEYETAKLWARYGMQNYSQYTDVAELHDIVDIYMNMSKSKSKDLDELFGISALKFKDYVWSLKCENSPFEIQEKCYNDLYLNFPKSEYGISALANLYFFKIKKHDYINAQKIGKDFLNKFPQSKSAPMVMFWLGKTYHYLQNYKVATTYYNNVIEKYPDSFYAYRAYLLLKNNRTGMINLKLAKEPVKYPLENVPNIYLKLARLNDYEIIQLINEDEFVKSWILYERGNYAQSIITARDAMENVYPKPNKKDLRWRLLYPLNYFEDIDKYAQDTALILAIIREESHFNPDVVSPVGAMGLMQLMPATAQDISNINVKELLNPDENIRLGIRYYAKLKKSLNNSDLKAVVAYNGGIGSVEKWAKNLQYNDSDEFIELIPYPETKNYVKKVFRSYWNYLRIYAQ